MIAPQAVSPSSGDDEDIARGDSQARLGEWSGALAAWQTALDGPEAERASKRIHWFLEETEQYRNGAASGRTRRMAYRVLMAATIAACLGTTATVLGSSRSGTEGTVVAISAWASFAIAIGLTLMFARMLGAPGGSSHAERSVPEAIALTLSKASTVESIETDPEKGTFRSSSVQDRTGPL